MSRRGTEPLNKNVLAFQADNLSGQCVHHLTSHPSTPSAVPAEPLPSTEVTTRRLRYQQDFHPVHFRCRFIPTTLTPVIPEQERIPRFATGVHRLQKPERKHELSLRLPGKPSFLHVHSSDAHDEPDQYDSTWAPTANILSGQRRFLRLLRNISADISLNGVADDAQSSARPVHCGGQRVLLDHGHLCLKIVYFRPTGGGTRIALQSSVG